MLNGKTAVTERRPDEMVRANFAVKSEGEIQLQSDFISSRRYSSE
jgi:hypothetical protein